MGRLEYDEFDLQLDRVGDGYTVRVVQSPTGPTAAVPFQLPGSPDSLKLLVLTLRAVRRIRALETEAAPDARAYGTELFNAIFHDDVLSALRGSLHVASSKDRGLRLRLRFTDPTTLANVPWELLYDPVRHRFLCQYGKYPVVRFLEIPEPVSPLTVEGPVRMLVVISAPRDYPELDVEAEWARLSTLLEPLVAAGRLQLDRLPKATLSDIHRALLEHEYHVFHYIGHGGVDPRSGDGVLALTGPDGLSRLELGQDLGVMLSNSPIRLAVLNSCEGARINDVDPYAGTAVSLVQQGIPAVVAMQFEISDEAAFAFSSTLYEAITDGRPIDLAVTLARQAILATSRTEWATPVLYLRTSDGVIFDIPHPAPVAQASAPVPSPAPPAAAPATPRESPAAQPERPPPGPSPGPPPEPGPPRAPTDLTATLVGRHAVDLRWGIPSAGAAAHAWDVLRNGEVVLRASEPAATDVVPGPGRYTYSVVAVDEQHRRSPESPPRSVFVDEPTLPLPAHQPTKQFVPVAPAAPPEAQPGHEAGRGADAPRPRRRGRLVLGLIALVLLGWLAISWLRPGGDAPAQPVGLDSVVDGQRVSLTWATPEGSLPVEEWIVLRDGEEAGRTQEPQFDDEPGEGDHTYAVLAVGADGVESPASEDHVVAVPAAPGPEPQPQPEPQPEPQPVPTVDLAVSVQPRGSGGGSGEVLVPFLVEEVQGEHLAEDVTVTITVGEGGRILDAVIGADTDAQVRCDEQSPTVRVCTLPELRASTSTEVHVIVQYTGTPFQVQAEVSSQTKDADPGNNADAVDIQTADIL